MWTYIQNADFPNYLTQHPQLEEYIDELSLCTMDDITFLPRGLINSFPSPYLKTYLGKTSIDPQSTNYNFKGTLRPVQQEAFTTIRKIHQTQGYVNGIIKLPPGRGKTTLAIYIAKYLGVRTLIVVNTKELVKQWVRSIDRFTDLTSSDIGLIGMNVFVPNKPIVVAMVQTLLSKVKSNFDKVIADIEHAQFGAVIYDEVHSTSSSSQFSKTSVLFRTKNIIGLSATPFQTKLHAILMNNTIGDMIFESKDYDISPQYWFIHYNSGLDLIESDWKNKKTQENIPVASVVHNTPDYIRKKGIYNSYIVRSQKYKDIIVKYVYNLIQMNHVVFILCMTKKQIVAISETLDVYNIEHRRFYGDESIIDKENDNVVIGTKAYCGEGFDMPRLSALLYACPLSGAKSVIQTSGRILRTSPDKQQPLIIDLIDESIPSLFGPEVDRKMKILTNEFPNGEIHTYREGLDENAGIT